MALADHPTSRPVAAEEVRVASPAAAVARGGDGNPAGGSPTKPRGAPPLAPMTVASPPSSSMKKASGRQ